MMDSLRLIWTICIIFLQSGLVKSDIIVHLRNYTYGPFKDKEGEFGYSYMGTFKGSIYLAEPRNGCNPINPPTPVLTQNQYVLIDDGDCSYYDKLWNAQNAKYDIAIIRNLDSDRLVTMKGPNIDQLGLYVGKTTGQVLERFNVTTGATVSVHVEFSLNLEIYLIPLVAIIGICFLLMLLFLVVKYWRARIQERRSRLTPANLKKIPTKKYKEGDEYDLCAICLEDYKAGEKLRILFCKHAYHCRCVDPWLTNGKKTCPVCKQPVEKGEARDKTCAVNVTETTPLLSETAPSTSTQAQQELSPAELA